MRNIKGIGIGLLLLISTGARAQETGRKAAVNTVELSLAARSQQVSGALAGYRLHGIGRKGRFKLGYGLRFTTYAGQKQDYVTAPARLTSGKTGPTVLFTEDIPAQFDTLSLPKAQVNWLNAAVFIEYAVLPRLDLGFTIDLIGVSIGKTQVGTFTARQSDNPVVSGTQQGAKPTTFNLLLTSDNDIGSLNSEFYVRYWVKERLGIKAGYSFIFTEYTADRKLTFDNDRFRNKSGLFMLGVTYAFNK